MSYSDQEDRGDCAGMHILHYSVCIFLTQSFLWRIFTQFFSREWEVNCAGKVASKRLTS
jgi:hypothetical protein